MTDALEMTQAEYARHRGVSRQAIGKLLGSGRLPFREDKGQKLIDVAAADRVLGETRERITIRDDPGSDDGRDAGRGFLPASDGGALTKAKTATEVYRARLAQLEYDERVGKLLALEDVTRSMEKCAASVVRDLDQLPNHAEDLAAAFTRDGILGLRLALKEVARTVRQRMADNMTVLASSDKPSEGAS
jgi:hypothetical protein